MGLPLLFAHGPRPQTFLQAAAWPRKLFLWASEGDVRDPRAPPFFPREQTQAPACHVRDPPPPPSKPYCVGITPALAKQRPAAWLRKLFAMPQLGPESFFYGLPKATLETHGPRPQTLLGSRQACRGLSVACPKPAPSLRPRAPASEGTLSSHPRLQSPTASASLLHWPNKGRSLAQKAFSMPQLGPESFFYGLPKATLETHGPRPQTLLGSRQACRGLSVACPKPGPFSSPTGPARKRSCRPQLGPESLFYGPASSLRPRAPPANVPAGRSLAQKAFSMGFRRQR